MEVRRVLAVAGASAVLALAFGFGVASGSPHVEPATDPGWTRIMQAMHDSPAMREMREAMGPELAVQCDAMHAVMQSADVAGMMAGMMGGADGAADPSTVAPGSHRAHHPDNGGAWSS